MNRRVSTNGTMTRNTLKAGIALIALAFASPAMAKPVDFDIDPQPLSEALKEFAQESGREILFSSDITRGKRSSNVDGRYNPETALKYLLRGTGLRYTKTSRNTFLIQAAGNSIKANYQAASENPNTSIQAPAGNVSEESDELIVVTGSRIRRNVISNETSNIPLQILNDDDIAQTGSRDLSEILEDIPGVSLDISPETSATSAQNAGLSTVALRRIGANRTLTLIDGLRAVSNSGNGERVSLNTLPTGFIKRLEVTTGGASAIYGSDAIAGVVNIILEDSFEGFKVAGRYGTPEASGGEEISFDATYGKKFADNRGYFLAAFSFDDHNAIFADNTRPESVANVEFNRPLTNPLDPTNPNAFRDETAFGDCDNSGRFCINPSGSTGLPGGIFEGDDAFNIGGVFFNDRAGNLPDDRDPRFGFETDVDGFNIRPGQSLFPSFENYNGAIRASFEASPTTEVFINLFYTHSTSVFTGSAVNVSSGTDIGPFNALGDIGTIAANNPFIPPEVEETRIGTVSFARRLSEIGRATTVNERQTFRGQFGLKGSISDNLNWDLGATYGRFEQRQDSLNQVNQLNVRNALNVTPDGLQCASEAARAEGCVPLNIFGEGSISTAAADFIRYNGLLEQYREQITVSGAIDGSAFTLPGGDVKFAVGFDFRHELQDTTGDPDQDLELTSLTTTPDFRGSFNVIEGFAELDVPIIEDQLSLQLAGRVANYSTVGTIFSYNVGGTWQPIDYIRFRAQYSRSQRAPSLTEFFSPSRPDFDNLVDPCDNLAPDGTGITPAAGSTASAETSASNCLTEPGIIAFFANPDNAGGVFNGAPSVAGPNVGNQNLQEETGTTYTAGAVFTPSFLPNFVLAVDYYNITVRDAIGSISTQLTADLCFSDADFPNNRFCDVITRDATTGQVLQVINRQENLNSVDVSGLDVSVLYNFRPQIIPGVFSIDGRYSHSFEDNFTFQSISGPETDDQLGRTTVSRNEFRIRGAWDYEGITLSWTATHRSGGLDRFVEPDAPNFFRVPAETLHNAFVRYSFGEDRRFSIFGGVTNVFDRIGPIQPQGLALGNSRNIISGLNDIEGREFFAGFRARF